MNKRFLVLFALIWGAMTACSKSQIHNEAPLSQIEAQKRIIVKINDSDLLKDQLLAASKSYRVLNSKQNLYELKGLSQDEALAIAPLSITTTNLYFDSAINSTFPNKTKMDFYKKLNQNVSPSAFIEEVPPALKGCDLTSLERPAVQVGLRSVVLAQAAVMNLGETALFKGSSNLRSLSEEGVEVRWDILPPASSNLTKEIKLGETFDLTPDTVGLYQLALIVKSKENSCGAKVIHFLVTHNPDIEFAKENEVPPTAGLEKFKHLKKINIEKAWQHATGRGIIVAVLDTGLNYNHVGIKYNLAINETEKNGTQGQDDDANDFEDDVLGWDFVNGDNKPFDDEGHGSHVSGLASSHVHGAAKGSKVLPIKVLNAAGGGDLASLIAGIYYATDNGAHIINTSLRFLNNVDVPALTQAIEYANSKNIVFVTASGNDSLDLSLSGNNAYPAEIQSPNIVSVAATGFDNGITSYSNFGAIEVQVAAPGGDQFEPIFSLTTLNPKNMPFIGTGGTSMASPIVAGVAALILETNPQLTPAQVRDLLMQSGNDQESLKGLVGSGKLLDAESAVLNAAKTQNNYSVL